MREPKFKEGDIVAVITDNSKQYTIREVIYHPTWEWLFCYRFVERPYHDQEVAEISLRIVDRRIEPETKPPHIKEPKFQRFDKVKFARHNWGILLIDLISYDEANHQFLYTFVDPGAGPSRVAENCLIKA